MKNIFQFADVRAEIKAMYPLVYSLCAAYAAEEPADFMIETQPGDIDYERFRADHAGYEDPCLETLAVCRKIAEKMPGYDAFLFHGSAIAADREAYIFTAASGTGKSTHARLWRDLLKDRAVMINDDKPLIRVNPDGTAIVYGTPWDGKHHLSRNISSPLRAVCILEQSEENQIREIRREEAFPMLVQQTYRPADPNALRQTMTLLNRMNVRFYRLSCNMEKSAAELSYNTMKG